jgi:putative ABC transport system permease protein
MDWTSRIRAGFGGAANAPDDDVVLELAQHAAAMYATARAEGCTQTEAEQRVDEQIERWRVESASLRRRSRRAPAVEPPAVASSRVSGLAQDLKYAMRLIHRQPRFALLVVLTMALGIGAATALFSVTYGVLLRPLPWPAGDRIIQLKETRGGNPPRFQSFTNASWLAWRDGATTIDGLAAWSQRTVTLGGAGDPERIRITAASAGLFQVLGARPLVGALFAEKDESSPVVVLSEGVWRGRFGADPNVLGSVVHLDGQPYIVIGVLPEAFAFPDRQARAVVPFAVRPAVNNYLSMFNAIARLKADVAPVQAAAEATGRARFAPDTGMTTMAVFGKNGPIEIRAARLRDALTADVRQPLVVLLAAVILLLVAATANVASLQLARGTSRRRELAIRAALGAGGARVIRQLMIENLVPASLGGAAGVAVAWLLNAAMPGLLPADFPRIDDLRIDRVVLSFAVAVSIVSGVAFGLAPALRLRRINLVDSLSEEGGGSVGSPSRTARARLVIMAGQVAIAYVLLLGASLLGQSFLALLRADRGFDPRNVITARLSLPGSMFTPERRFAIVSGVLDRLSAHPGVRQAAFTSELPLTPGGSTAAFTMRSPAAGGATVQAQASPRIVSSELFAALDMHLVAGRGLTQSDTGTSEPIVVVNQAFARRYLGENPLGAKLPLAGYARPNEAPMETTVVGVVEDVRYLGASTTSLPELYYSYRQIRGGLPVPVVTLTVRTDGEVAPIAQAIRAAVREADPALVAESIVTMEERLMMTLARPRLYAVLLGGFAACALAIAAIGLFGALSYSVAQRSRELAVRSALGARRIDIARLIVRQALGVIVAGLAAGLLASMWLTSTIASQLYGISTRDATTYVAVPLALVIVSAVACVVPARRAATLDPLKILRAN